MNIEKSNCPVVETRQVRMPCIFKIQLTAEGASSLQKRFDFGEPKERSYVYFDTSPFLKNAQLFQHHLRLRVRIKGTERNLEVKNQRTKKHVTQPLSCEEYQHLLIGSMPEGGVKMKLVARGLCVPVRLIDSVISLRRKADYFGGKLVIDQTITTNGTPADFTLEFRSVHKFSPRQIGLLIRGLDVPNTPVRQSKLEKFWEGR